MKRLAVLLALSVAVPAAAHASRQASTQAPEGVRLSTSMDGRKASLLGGETLVLDETAVPLATTLAGFAAQVPATAFGPELAGGGVGSDARPILALLLSIFPGFGLGYLVAGQRNGFVLFLIVDLAIITVTWTLSYFVGGPFGLLGWLALIISHVYQAIDSYGAAGGGRLVQMTRERAVEIASASEEHSPAITTSRLFAFSF